MIFQGAHPFNEVPIEKTMNFEEWVDPLNNGISGENQVKEVPTGNLIDLD